MPPKRKREVSSLPPTNGNSSGGERRSPTPAGGAVGRTSPNDNSSTNKRSRGDEKTFSSKPGITGSSSGGEIKSAGYLITCDVPTRQFITYLNKKKTTDKKFIIEELDATHLLVKKSARGEIDAAVEKWMDDNVFSAIERVGENLDMS